MLARPTDRTPTLTLEKMTTRFTQAINDYTILQPVNSSVNRLARRAICHALKHIQFGSITIIEDADDKIPNIRTFGNYSKDMSASSSAVGRHPLHVTLMVHDMSVYRQLLFGGSIALADSYINGEWDTDNLTGLIRLAARNLAVLNTLENRFAGISKTLERAKTSVTQ